MARLEPIGLNVQSYARWLWILAGLFALRVAAQPLALVVNSRFLPRFESWHSGVVPYPLLVGAQLLILLWLLSTAWFVARGAVRPVRKLGGILIGAAGLYGVTMLARLVLGATLLRDERWFASPLPTVFHLVLASYLYVYGRLHYRHG